MDCVAVRDVGRMRSLHFYWVLVLRLMALRENDRLELTFASRNSWSVAPLLLCRCVHEVFFFSHEVFC